MALTSENTPKPAEARPITRRHVERRRRGLRLLLISASAIVALCLVAVIAFGASPDYVFGEGPIPVGVAVGFVALGAMVVVFVPLFLFGLVVFLIDLVRRALESHGRRADAVEDGGSDAEPGAPAEHIGRSHV